MVKLPSLNLSMGLTQKESVLYMVWKAEGISSLSRHCNTTARLPHSQISINSLSSTIQSREVTLFPRKKESWRQVCCLNGAWVQGEARAALAPAMRTLVSASWLSRIHSRSSLSLLMWPVSDFCLLSRQQKCTTCSLWLRFLLADVLNFKQAIWLFLQFTGEGVFAAWLLMLSS